MRIHLVVNPWIRIEVDSGIRSNPWSRMRTRAHIGGFVFMRIHANPGFRKISIYANATHLGFAGFASCESGFAWVRIDSRNTNRRGSG